MRNASREAVEAKYYDGIHRLPSCISHELIECGPFFPRPADSMVDVLSGDPPTAAVGILAQCRELHVDVLIGRRHPTVKRAPHVGHEPPPLAGRSRTTL